MKDQLDHSAAALNVNMARTCSRAALNATRTGVPVVAIGRAKTGLDGTFAIAVAE